MRWQRSIDNNERAKGEMPILLVFLSYIIRYTLVSCFIHQEAISLPTYSLSHRQAHLFTKAMILAVICYTFLILFGSLILTKTMTKTQWCPTYDYSEEIDMYSNSTTIMLQANNKYENPDYNNDPCHYQRLPFLLYLTMEEADCCRRMFLSVMMGGAIGFERRSSDRPAGVRTMGLVSLGACFFTISSQLAFKGSTMGWDSSRVTAAIPSGCGFLGAGLIWKGTVGTGRKDERHEVHGLTTAAGVWLSAAIGTGCGGRLYFVSGYSCILVTIILRYGPKIYFQETEVGAARDVGNYSDMDDMTDDDGLVGEEEDENDSSRSNCSSLEAVREEGEISVAEMKNKKGRLSTADEDESNATISRTTRITATSTMEGIRVALVDANELKMFEAWKREREQISVQSSRNKTSSETGMVGIGRIGFDSDISCSDASSSRQYGR